MNHVLNRKAVVARTNLSRSTIDRLVQKGEFPPPIRLSTRRVGWLENAVDQWLADRRRFVNSAMDGEGYENIKKQN